MSLKVPLGVCFILDVVARSRVPVDQKRTYLTAAARLMPTAISAEPWGARNGHFWQKTLLAGRQARVSTIPSVPTHDVTKLAHLCQSKTIVDLTLGTNTKSLETPKAILGADYSMGTPL